MRVVGGHVPHVLQEDHLSDAGQHGRDDDRDDAGAVDGDAGGVRDRHVVSDGAHVLAELGPLEPDDEEAQATTTRKEAIGSARAPAFPRGIFSIIRLSRDWRTESRLSVLRMP